MGVHLAEVSDIQGASPPLFDSVEDSLGSKEVMNCLNGAHVLTEIFASRSEELVTGVSLDDE